MNEKNEKSFVQKMCEHRDKKIISAYKKGERIELIEAFFGITKQRIYQILDEYSVAKTRHKKKLSTVAK